MILLDIGRHPALEEALQVAVDVHLPRHLSPTAKLFFCLPGGGMTRRYFDLQGGDGDGFSFAQALTQRGHVVVAVDPVGVGDSTRPADGYALTAEVEAELMHRALAAVRALEVESVALGALAPIGTGHSAGAMLAVCQQAAYRDFVALAVFCFGSAGLPDQLAPDYLAAIASPDRGRARIAEFAHKMFGQPYLELRTREQETPAARALGGAAASVISVMALQAITPGNVREELEGLDVPVFVAAGNRDMVGPPHRLGLDYAGCPDFTLHVGRDSGHHVFLAAGAERLYRRLSAWADILDLAAFNGGAGSA